MYAGELKSESLLPPKSITGYAYLIRSGTEVGTYKVWNGTSYDAAFTPTYGWYQSTDGLSPTASTVTDLVNPASYVDGATTKYRELQYVKGIRIVVNTMKKKTATFDLIEMSPRLVADLSDITMSYTANKVLSDLGSGIPVGQLLASKGSLTLFDDEQAFNPNNANSIIKDFSSINLQIKFYEIISQVNDYDYYVPIKT